MSRALEGLLGEQPSAAAKAEMLESLGLVRSTRTTTTSASSAQQQVSHYGDAPMPTELQRAEVEKLAKSLKQKQGRSSTTSASPRRGGEEESDDEAAQEETYDVSTFDLLSRPRVVLLQGKLLKRSTTSSFKMKLGTQSKRHLFLLNDLLLVTSAQSQLLKSSERFVVHNILPLEDMAFRPYFSSDANPSGASSPQVSAGTENAIEIVTSEKVFHFLSESDSDRRIWIETLSAAIIALLETRASNNRSLLPGYIPHQILRGTIASAAMRADMTELAFLLQRGGVVINATDEYSLTPIHWAALSGNVKIVEQLVQQGADTNSLNNALNSPLLLAAAGGYTDIVVYLLENEADPHVRNMKDRDALFNAALYAHRSSGLSVILEALLQRGCELDAFDSSGHTALHACASRGLLHSIQILCDLGSSVNARTTELGAENGGAAKSLTPLLIACSQDQADAEVIRMLLDKGAHPNAKFASSLSSSSSSSSSSQLNAMDAILQSFAQRRAAVNRSALSSTSAGSSKIDGGSDDETDLVNDFVQNCLPALMELAKRGCRYSDSVISSLRPSFVEAINGARQHWVKLSEPPQFQELVDVAHVLDDSWAHDSSSACCLCCGEAFSFTSRRHHCRACGILCCKDCSGKTLSINNASPGGSPRSPPSGAASIAATATSSITSPTSAAAQPQKPQRVCDACFNSSLFLFECRFSDMIRVQSSPTRRSKDVPALDAPPPLTPSLTPANPPAPAPGAATNPPTAPQTLSPRTTSSLFSWSGSSKSAAATPRETAPPAASQTAAGAASEALEAMQLRGQKLGDLADKGAEMNDAASEFHSLSAQLRKQMQERSIGWM